MSALAGVWNMDGRPGAVARCARMLASQEIYGRIDGKPWSDGAIALGRRLFRTLPEDLYDRQPLHSADGRLVLVADVRLDNREDLCEALRLRLTPGEPLSDAAILLESLAKWGEEALDRLVGDFAFALWDMRAQRLLLARDFLGQRPLHYHSGKDFFAFASMPKGLHALPEIPYGPDEQVTAEFVTLIPQTGPRSFFKDVSRVEAGHFVTITREGLSSRRYWNPAGPETNRSRATDYVEGLRHHLDQATRSMLRGSDGIVGTHLSAGLDSSAVASTAARLLGPAGKAYAFTAVPREGYDGPCPAKRVADEGPLAAATAAMYPNIEHVLIQAGPRSPLEQLDRYFFLFDRPALNLCNWVWLDALNSAARDRKLKIMLNGQMGNMSLSYGGLERLAALLGRGHLFTLLREGAQLISRGGASWRSVLAHTFGPYLPPRLWQAISETYRGKWDILQYTAIRPSRLDSLGLSDIARERGLDFTYRPWKNPFDCRLWVLGRVDLGNYNKGTLAGWGIDQRDPTADKRLVEYCLRAPLDQFMAKGQTRMLARRALSDRVPQAVLDHPYGGYQAADWHEGLRAARGELRSELGRLEACGPASDTLDIQRLQGLVEKWPDDGWERHDIASSYRLALLRGVSAGHFLRKASRSNA